MEENKFDFKFLNKVMYILAVIVIFLALRETGIVDKAAELIKSLTPFFVGVVICWFSKPLANRLRKLGINKSLAAFIALIIIFAIVILVISYTVPLLVTQITQFIKELPNLYTTSVNKINLLLYDRFGVDSQISTSIKDLDLISNAVVNILNYSLDTAQKAGSFVISAITAIIISFFMVKDMDRTKNTAIAFLSKNSKDSRRYKMLTEMDEVLNSYVRGLTLDSVIVGVMTTVLCIILKLDYAVIFGILIMFLNLIPYIGAVISYSIISLYAFTVGGPILAVITLAASIAIQMIDANILQPNIIGKSVKLHPVVVICGLLVFERLFGLVGMIIAMPLLALGKIYLKHTFGVNFESSEDIEENRDKKRKVKVQNKKTEV